MLFNFMFFFSNLVNKNHCYKKFVGFCFVAVYLIWGRSEKSVYMLVVDFWLGEPEDLWD